MSLVRRVLVATAVVALLVSATWPTVAAEATIHPGVQTVTNGAQCTANFVFSDGTDMFIGQAAHCASTGAANETDGCLARSLPLGTPVEIAGATRPGTLAYSSWLTMQRTGEGNADVCAYNDFALVRIDPADHARVSPALPFFGGPACLNTGGVGFGESVFSYGNSSLRFGLTALSPKEGTSLGTDASGWTHPVYTATPGVPGDSGSAFLDANGCALGVLSTLAIAPLAGSNNVTDLSRALAYMKHHTALDAVELRLGGEFEGGVLS